MRREGMRTALTIATSVAVAALSLEVVAARRVRLNMTGATQKEESAGAETASEEAVKVTGRGLGLNKDAALKDAFRDAIEKAIGLYVDAETIAKNDEIIKDQIMTHSNAYVSHYDESSTKQLDGGLTEVRIVATVNKRDLNQKLDGFMPTQRVRVGVGSLKDTYAKSATTEKRGGDAAALLEKALAGLNPVKSLLVANVRADTQKILTAEQVKRNGEGLGANQEVLRYLFELRLDRKKYFEEFVPNLKGVLDQISLAAPKEVRLQELAERERGSGSLAAEIKKYKAGEHVMSQKRNGCSYYIQVEGILDGLHVYSFNDGTGNRVWPFGGGHQFSPKAAGSFSWADIELENGRFSEHYAKATAEVALITKLNDDGSMGKVTLYSLDKPTLEVWNKWMQGLIDVRKDITRVDVCDAKVNYSIVLEDAKGNELAVFPWEVPVAALMNVKFAEQPNKGHVFVTPFVGCFGESYIELKNLIVDKSLLPKIDAIKIELVQ